MGLAQIKGRVVNQDGQALPFVNISFGQQGGTVSDLDGQFQIPAGVQGTLHFSYVGYAPLSRAADALGPDMPVVLQALNTELEAATVFPGRNPAHRIIEHAVKRRAQNDPEQLEYFRYFAYSKFWVSVNPDSLEAEIDTLGYQARPDSLAGDSSLSPLDSIPILDSSGYRSHKFFSERYLFFMETLTERQHSTDRDNETVLAQRTSGFKNPLFALLVTQLQSFSFYGNYIGITGDEYLNPISPASTNRYFFILEDTLFRAPGDSSFVISFRPRPKKGFRALKGVLTIHAGDWAIENVRAQPADEEGLPITIRQEYAQFGNQGWFPIAFEADLLLPLVSVNGARPTAVMRRRLQDIKLSASGQRQKMSSARISIAQKEQAEQLKLLAHYRNDSLKAREQETYQFIDSLSEAENLERNLFTLLTLRRGHLPWKKIDIDLGKIVNYNTQEGWRLGLGLSTNQRWSDRLQVKAYFAYGFKDQTSKYGLETKWDIQKDWRLSGRMGYCYDIFETGGMALPLYEEGGLFSNNYRRFLIEQWDQGSKLYTAWRVDPLPKLSYALRFEKESRLSRGTYRFEPQDGPRGRAFQYVSLSHTLRYAPQEEYAETPLGKIILKGGMPVFYLSYEHGFKGFWSGDFQYDRFQFKGLYRHKTLRWGTIHLELNAGWTVQELPYQKLFAGAANAISSADFLKRAAGPADRNSFETMRFNEFISDQIIQLQWRQDFQSLFYKTERFAPHLELVNRFAIGALGQKELHQGLAFQSLEKGYWESGLELNRLLVWKPINFGLGLGFYYRYGAYHLDTFGQNLAIKLTSKFQF